MPPTPKWLADEEQLWRLQQADQGNVGALPSARHVGGKLMGSTIIRPGVVGVTVHVDPEDVGSTSAPVNTHSDLPSDM